MKMKKLMAAGLTAILIAGMIPANVQAKSNAGWKKDATGWWYRNEDGSYPASDWQQINGRWYHFDGNGYMQTGWIKDNGTWYYLNPDGAMATGWKKTGGKWYYMSPGGAMQTGWVKDNGEWYYLDADGAMKTGQFRIGDWRRTDSKVYYCYPDGHMASDCQVGNSWYLEDGSRAEGQWVDNYTLYAYDDEIKTYDECDYYEKSQNPYAFEYRLKNHTASLDEMRQYILDHYNKSVCSDHDTKGRLKLWNGKVAPGVAVKMNDRYNEAAQWYAEYLERTYYDLSKCGPACHRGLNQHPACADWGGEEGIFQVTPVYMEDSAEYMPEHMLLQSCISTTREIGIGVVWVDRIQSYIGVIESFDPANGDDCRIPDELPDISTIPILHKEK